MTEEVPFASYPRAPFLAVINPKKGHYRKLKGHTDVQCAAMKAWLIGK